MEDRSPTGVILEMANCTDPARQADFESWYEQCHIPDLASTGAVYSGIRFKNCKPSRTEYPRKIPEATYLTVYETDWPDAHKAYEAVTRRWPVWQAQKRFHPAFQSTFFTMYRRRPEPPQGHMSEKKTTGIFLILVRGDEGFNHWAKFVHLRYIAQANAPGYTMITRYENAVSETEGPRYLHLYELVTEDAEADRAKMAPAVEKLLGGADTPLFKHWAKYPGLDIWYVNTFQRVSP